MSLGGSGPHLGLYWGETFSQQRETSTAAFHNGSLIEYEGNNNTMSELGLIVQYTPLTS